MQRRKDVRCLGEVAYKKEGRQVKERCRNCKHFCRESTIGVTGSCRRYPPQIVFPLKEITHGGFQMDCKYPFTYYDCWCGEWKRKAGKP